ncbi:MAG: alpha-ketoacid dehydrogenase subunit beta [Anaerofustis sp.]
MKELTYAQAVREALRQALNSDPSVILTGAAVTTGGDYGVTEQLNEEFGAQRIIDTPTSENGTVGMALGLAMTGALPIVEIKGNFLLRCLDTIANQIAINEFQTNAQYDSAVIIRSDVGYDPFLGPQKAQSYESMFCQIPGLTVLYPSCGADAIQLMNASVQLHKPVLFLENRAMYRQSQQVPDDTSLSVPIGKAHTLQEGTDVTIITYGPCVDLCRKAAERAKLEEINCEVIDLRTLYPFDKETIVDSVKKTGKAIIVHEAHLTGGLGAEIAACIADSEAFDYLEAPIKRIASDDTPIAYSPEQYRTAVPDVQKIYDIILELTC